MFQLESRLGRQPRFWVQVQSSGKLLLLWCPTTFNGSIYRMFSVDVSLEIFLFLTFEHLLKLVTFNNVFFSFVFLYLTLDCHFKFLKLLFAVYRQSTDHSPGNRLEGFLYKIFQLMQSCQMKEAAFIRTKKNCSCSAGETCAEKNRKVGC